MTFLRPSFLLVLVCVLTLPQHSSPEGRGSDLPEIVAGLQRRYAAVQTISARFQQVYRAPGIEQTESGTLFMKKPGLMRWEYREPEIKIFVADGRKTYLFAPEDRQVMVRAWSADELRSTPLRLLLGQGDIRAEFSVSWETEFKPVVEATVLIRLVPRTPDPEFAYVVLECDSRTYELRRIVVREPSGNYSEFILTDVVTNIRMDDKQFRFKVPKGVEVIHVDDKE